MNYQRILSRMVGVPLAIRDTKLQLLAESVIVNLVSGVQLASGVAEPTQKDVPQTNGAIAVVNIFDTLVSKGGAGESGFTSYSGLKARTEQVIAAGASTIIYYLDTPGGENAGLFSFVDYVGSLPSRGVKTIAFSDGQCTSAGYAIASACQEIFSTETAIWGSIACMMVHMDQSQKDTADGKVYSIFTSKPNKALGNSHQPLSEEAISKIESILAINDAAFNNVVAKYRPQLTVEAIVGMKGDIFLGEEVLSLGLVDGFVSGIDSVISACKKKGPTSQSNRGVVNMSIEQVTAELEVSKKLVSEMQIERANLTTEVSQLKTQLASSSADSVAAERTRNLTIFAAAEKLGLPASVALSHIEKGVSAELSLEVMTLAAETKASLSAVNSNLGPGHSLDDPAKSDDTGKVGLLQSYSTAKGLKVPS